MLGHEFTFREKLLIILFAILFTAIFVYEVAVVGIDRQMESYSTEQLETELMIEQSKSVSINNMKQIIADSEGKVVGTLSVYDNLTNEILEMSTIFGENADNVSISWSDPVLSGTIVRRDVSIRFTTSSYEGFRNILKRLSECQYRALIKNVTVSGYSSDSDIGLARTDDIDASISLTFYETTEGAQSLSGLTVVDETN